MLTSLLFILSLPSSPHSVCRFFIYCPSLQVLYRRVNQTQDGEALVSSTAMALREDGLLQMYSS